MPPRTPRRSSPLHPVPAPPAFFLARTPHEGDPSLLPHEDEHARVVLALGPGDACLGLDGRGHRWPLRVTGKRGGALTLEVEGLPEIEPEPGQEGALLPWLEVAVAWPAEARAAVMLDALVQLGAAAITPLEGREPLPADVLKGAAELARTACKTSGRTWLPVLNAPRMAADLIQERAEAGSALAYLDPHAGMSLDTWLRSLRAHPLGTGTRDRPIVMLIGPAGGLSGSDRTALLETGTTWARLGPHVMQTETAALSALAVAATVLCGVYPDERA